MSENLPVATNHQQPVERRKSIDLLAENNRLRLELFQAVEDLEVSQQMQGHLEAALIRKTHELDIVQSSGPLHMDDDEAFDAWKNFEVQQMTSRHNSALVSEKMGNDLIIAVSNNDVPTTTMMLEKLNADVKFEDDSGASALIYAAKFGSAECAKVLLEHGADVDHTDNSRSSPLIYASKYGHIDIGRILIDHKADVNHRNIYALTPLVYAAKYGHVVMTKFLLQRGAVVDLVNIYGSTALTAAALHGKAEVVKLLIDARANVNHRDRSGWSPLISSIQRDYAEVAKLLLDHGADISLKAESGWTALFFAVKGDDIKTVKMLLDYGAEVNIRSTESFSYFMPKDKTSTVIGKGWTPLMMAAFLGKPDFARLLLSHEADMAIKSDDGKTAFDLAATDELKRILKIA